MNDPKLNEATAHDAHLRFSVGRKEARGRPWTKVRTNLVSLSDAMREAQSLAAASFETGVLVETTSGRLVYWSSRDPEIRNSSALNAAAAQMRRGLLSQTTWRIADGNLPDGARGTGGGSPVATRRYPEQKDIAWRLRESNRGG